MGRTKLNQDLVFRLRADIAQLKKGLKQGKAKINGFSNSVRQLGGIIAATFAFGAIKGFIRETTKAFNIQAQQEKKLLVALKGRTDIQERLIKQARDLQKTTLFGDEETIKAQSLLATLGLSEEAIFKLTPLVQDMATALGTDLASAASLVGKSVSTSTDALARYFDTGLKGVNGATERAIVLTESLSKMMGGQAVAAAEVGTGAITQLSNAFGDLQETIGKILTQDAGGFIGFLNDVVTKTDDFLKGIDQHSIDKRRNSIAKFRNEIAELTEDIARSDRGEMGVFEAAFFSEKATIIQIQKLLVRIDEHDRAIVRITGKKEDEVDVTIKTVDTINTETAARDALEKKLTKEAATRQRLNKEKSAAAPTTQTVLGGLEGLREFSPLLDTSNIKLQEINTTFDGFKEKGSFAAGIVGNAFQGMSNVITDALNSTENIFQAFGKFFGNFIKGLVIKLVSATIAALALMAVLALFSGITGGAAFGAVNAATTFGEKFMKSLGAIGGFADGGVSTGGLAMVGERGREIVAMPQGSRVLSHQQTVNAVGGGGSMNINVTGIIRGEDIWLANTEAGRRLGNTRG